MTVSVSILKGEAILPYVNDLARMRMTVFREYPYLYEGELEYEMGYLKRFIENPNSVMVAVKNEKGEVVGASTACPMENEMHEVREVFIEQGHNISEWFYLSESILLPAYRGQGLGKLFFQAREEMARSQSGIKYLAFCAIEREPNHPLQPKNYQSLEGLWIKQGFKKHPELVTYFDWKEIDQPTKIDHKMVFWTKSL